MHPHEFNQTPLPGTHRLAFQGDTITFSLNIPGNEQGNAWVRTNIGHAAASRREVIEKAQKSISPLGKDWFDIPMIRSEENLFRATLPLCEVGHFQAKCFFLKKGEYHPLWPEGGNVVLNVEPADTCCANIIYNAFVRQFGPNKKGDYFSGIADSDSIENLDKAGYTVIPPSGTFRDLAAELDFIIGTLGCRIIHLLPVHPTPTTYARMGRFGSPYAALNFTTVDPAQAEFDPGKTPLEQFLELVDAVHRRNAKIIMDIAINHTGWAADLHETHPHWLVRDEKGQIQVPGAWGVQWSDLTKLDYSYKQLWEYMADVFLTWCRRGIDGFRCDAGYMIPTPAWQYIVAKVREQFPDTLFFLEGLGGRVSVSRDILNIANFNWAYSELFQNYDRSEIEHYLPQAMEISQGDGIMVHFAETHDNNRLASRSRIHAKMRTTLCALCSHEGGFGFANGVEWFATEKINVHQSPSLNWGGVPNQVDHIRRLTRLLKNHPAFSHKTRTSFIQQGEGNHIALLRHHLPSDRKILVVVNLDDAHHTMGSWLPERAGFSGNMFTDLLTGSSIAVTRENDLQTFMLAPGQVLCLSPDYDDLKLTQISDAPDVSVPKQIIHQRLKAKALEVYQFYQGIRDIGDFDPDRSAEALAQDPVSFCREFNSENEESRVITWQWPEDRKREVMLPPCHFLLIRSDTPLYARIVDAPMEKDEEKDRILSEEKSLPGKGGSHFVLFSPLSSSDSHRPLILRITLYENEKSKHVDCPLLQLSETDRPVVKTAFCRTDLLETSLLQLSTNNRGGMLRAHVPWGTLGSKYDALLAGNLNPEFPEDRWIMLTRCRAWVVYQGYSQELRLEVLDAFSFDFDGGCWRYKIPTGQGEHIHLIVRTEMVPDENTIRLTFYRMTKNGADAVLDNDKEVRIILRPDIEDRNFHHNTKAYQGPEEKWGKAVRAMERGFVFEPEQTRSLSVFASTGSFICESEWYYGVHRRLEAERGMDAESDLFSPGYFSAFLSGDQHLILSASINKGAAKDTTDSPLSSDAFQQQIKAVTSGKTLTIDASQALQRAMDSYVVKRDPLKSVIAGYPWFLDWGRDSLIFTRGLIAAGKLDDAKAVLKQFGRFENEGTLPNMILGKNAGNRDTSDAPLWFFVSCSDLTAAEDADAFLDEKYGEQSIKSLLLSMAGSIINGTPNGIAMDSDSGLIYSPPHFTWMDTDHPAGTPREGYCIEIQALWYAALMLLSRIDPKSGKWKKLAETVQQSIKTLFRVDDEYLADCLHAPAGTPAQKAEPDDALRPNQLFAVTMGAVSDRALCRNILSNCKTLLVPGSIRSLADRPVRHPLEIELNGRILNDPHHPYQGIYSGDEDSRRKPAYHNGTTWTWVFPTFCEAWVKVYGEKAKKTALAWLSSSTRLIDQGCAGHIPEITDGDFPHTPRGCDAQAWGASEWVRVYELLN